MDEVTSLPLPLKMVVHWWVKIFSVFGIIFGLGIAVMVFLSGQAILVALGFILFTLLSIYMLISANSRIDIDQNAITVSLPPEGVYRMYLKDVQYVETNGERFAFVGDGKYLVFLLGFAYSGKREFLAFFENFVKERQLEVKPLSSLWLKQKNTKVS